MFDLPSRAIEIRNQVEAFFNDRILPNHKLWQSQADAGEAVPAKPASLLPAKPACMPAKPACLPAKPTCYLAFVWQYVCTIWFYLTLYLQQFGHNFALVRRYGAILHYLGTLHYLARSKLI